MDLASTLSLQRQTLNYIKRLMAHQPMVESILNLIGDGSWNTPEAGASQPRRLAGRSGRSAALQHYFGMLSERNATNVRLSFYPTRALIDQLYLPTTPPPIL